MKYINIAIDGPSAAGKSSVANSLAETLSFIHLDTGSMYRAVAYMATQRGFSLDDEKSIVDMIKHSEFIVENDGTIVFDGLRLKEQLYGNEISLMASDVSKLLGVRQALVAKQQAIAQNKGYILDGRDIGTVVLPDAEVKIYLTASAEARALRRTRQNEEKGLEANYEEILAEIQKRDYQDTHREHSPLKKADDAITVDSSDMSLQDVLDTIERIVKEKTEL